MDIEEEPPKKRGRNAFKSSSISSNQNGNNEERMAEIENENRQLRLQTNYLTDRVDRLEKLFDNFDRMKDKTLPQNSGNGERIAELEKENQHLRSQINSLTDRMDRLEKLFDNFINNKERIDEQQQYHDGKDENEEEEEIDNSQMPSSSESISQLLNSVSKVIALSGIEESSPSWSIISEAAAKEIYSDNSEPISFIRKIYKNLFTEIQTFQLELPSDLQKEYEKICAYFLNPYTVAELKKFKEMLKTEFRYQREKLRTRITVSKNAAVAMCNIKAIPLKKIAGDIWIPQNNDIQFQRFSEEHESISKWPILMKNGKLCDTMFAQRKNPSNSRSYWKYFIITADGVFIACSSKE